MPKLDSQYVAELDHLMYLNLKAYALNLYSTGPDP